MEYTNENQPLIEAMRDLHGAREVAVQGHTLLVVPRGMEVKDVQATIDARVDQRGIAPRRCMGTTKVNTLDAFIAAVARFKTDSTIVYVNDGNQPQFVAVLNESTDAATPGWRDHRIAYSPAVAEEWSAWMALNGKSLTQSDFAQFLEERCLDLRDGSKIGPKTKEILDALNAKPATPAAVQALAKGLSIKVDCVVKEVRNLDSGEAQIQYTEEHSGEGGKPLDVPRAFVIAIPVFLGGAAYAQVVRLRYKANQGRIVWSYTIVHSDAAKRDAVLGMIEALSKSLPDVLTVEGVA